MLSTIVDLILILLYLNLGLMTFEELNKKEKTEDTQKRVLLKWMIATVFFSCFWIFEWTFSFLPTSFVKLPLGLWIMLPQFYGEYMLLNMLADVFDKLEYYPRKVRNSVASGIFGVPFAICTHSFSAMKKYIPTDKLKDFQNQIRTLDKEINDEVRIRKTIMQQMSGKDYKAGSGKNYAADMLRDSTIVNPMKRAKPPTYFNPPGGHIYTPVGMFTKSSSSLLEVDENQEEDFAGYKHSRTVIKEAPNSRQGSERGSKRGLASVGKTSSYIDPQLSEKLNSPADIKYEDKDTYRRSRKSTKKAK